MEDVVEGKDFSFPEEEETVLRLWRDIDAFKQQLKRTEGKKEYVFYDGPPFATGLPHYGHILAGTLKVSRPLPSCTLPATVQRKRAQTQPSRGAAWPGAVCLAHRRLAGFQTACMPLCSQLCPPPNAFKRTTHHAADPRTRTNADACRRGAPRAR